MSTYQEHLAQADAQMESGSFHEAMANYQAAWSQGVKQLDGVHRVWLLLSIANAALRGGQHEEAFKALSAVANHYADTGVVAGNPLFHLLVGLTYHALQEDEEAETDNFARALICGGPAIFTGEDPAHLERMMSLLEPPQESGTWTGYTGCSRELLNHASGYLRELLTRRLGDAPPYHYED